MIRATVLVGSICILQYAYIIIHNIIHSYCSPQGSIVHSYNFNTIAVCRHTCTTSDNFWKTDFQMSIMYPTSRVQVFDQELYNIIFGLERNSFFYLFALLARTHVVLYFAHSCTKRRFPLLLAEVKPCSLKTIYTTILLPWQLLYGDTLLLPWLLRQCTVQTNGRYPIQKRVACISISSSACALIGPWDLSQSLGLSNF